MAGNQLVFIYEWLPGALKIIAEGLVRL